MMKKSLIILAFLICGCANKNTIGTIRNEAAVTGSDGMNYKGYSQKIIENACSVNLGDNKKVVIDKLGDPQKEEKHAIKGISFGPGYFYVMTYDIYDKKNKQKDVSLIIYLNADEIVYRMCITSNSPVFITLKDTVLFP